MISVGLYHAGDEARFHCLLIVVKARMNNVGSIALIAAQTLFILNCLLKAHHLKQLVIYHGSVKTEIDSKLITLDIDVEMWMRNPWLWS